MSVSKVTRVALGLGATLLLLGGCAMDMTEDVTSTEQPLLSAVDCPIGYNVILGTQGRDIIQGTSGNDCILGFGGNDNITGKVGNDFIAGGTGDDILNGNQGDDQIFGEDGNDSLNGGLTGNDTIFGGLGDDSIDGFNGNDTINGEEGNDIIDGDTGNDVINGGVGNDVIVDASGTNTIDGGDGNDACTNGSNCELSEPGQTCTVTADCAGGRICNTQSNVCVFCQNDSQCPSNQACTPTVGCGGEGDCSDTIDNDSDGFTDCADSECALNPVCVVGVTELGGGFNHQCVSSAGNAYCWGRNNSGQLGYVTTPDRFSNTAQAVAPLNGLVSGVSSGNYHSCARLNDQTVRCWGSNTAGQLGNGMTVNSIPPVVVTGLANITEISAGGSHSCAVDTSHQIWCWGSNVYGQLGNSSNVNSSTPVLVSGTSNFTHVAAGHEHTCATRSTGTIACWGNGANGRLGNGANVSSNVPVSLTGVSGFVFDQLSVGQAHGCARRNNGRVYCWGWNRDGQVGDGTVVDRSTPILVSATTGTTTASAGHQHSCAMRSDGTIRCWGRNSDGQVGNDTFASPVLLPQQVVSMTTAVAVGAGGWQTCARLSSGVMQCWGDNEYGQVGNASMSDATGPASVVGIP